MLVAPSQDAFTDLRSTMHLKNEEVGSLYSLWKLELGDLTGSAEGRASTRTAVYRLVQVLATTDLSELSDLEANVHSEKYQMLAVLKYLVAPSWMIW